jgi:hypothetical protein
MDILFQPVVCPVIDLCDRAYDFKSLAVRQYKNYDVFGTTLPGSVQRFFSTLNSAISAVSKRAQTIRWSPDKISCAVLQAEQSL